MPFSKCEVPGTRATARGAASQLGLSGSWLRLGFGAGDTARVVPCRSHDAGTAGACNRGEDDAGPLGKSPGIDGRDDADGQRVRAGSL